MIRYLITDGSAAHDLNQWLEKVEFWLGRVDFVQIRERELTARELANVAKRVCARRGTTKVLLNDHADIAVAAGADGVHLRDGSLAPCDIRRIARPELIISVACHDREGVVRAAQEGADYILLAPVFAPISKIDIRPRLGLQKLRDAAASVDVPVLALGGITERNAAACIDAGAVGVAGISLFSRGNQ